MRIVWEVVTPINPVDVIEALGVAGIDVNLSYSLTFEMTDPSPEAVRAFEEAAAANGLMVAKSVYS